MLEEGTVIIHYRRYQGDYRDWGLHVWGPRYPATDWGKPLAPSGWDEFGVYWEVAIQANTPGINFVIHRGDEKDPGPDQEVVIQRDGREVWVIEGDTHTYSSPEMAEQASMLRTVGDFFTRAEGYWLARDLFFWPHEGPRLNSYHLLFHPTGGIRFQSDALTARKEIDLEVVGTSLPADLAERFPHLHHGQLLKMSGVDNGELQRLLRGQLVLAGKNSGDQVVKAAGVQLHGVLDEVYFYDGHLGVTYSKRKPVIRVWAPTAQRVSLVRFADSQPDTEGQLLPMVFDPDTGVWEATGEPTWDGSYYLFSVEVYVPRLGKHITNVVTDPYSISLAMNSKRSQIIDIEAQELMPPGWLELEKPPLAAKTDAVLYELHIRDFSARDETVSPPNRGKYRAFLAENSNGVNHLKRLAGAGLTHIHLLPIMDNASYDEDQASWGVPDYKKLGALPPDSDEQQRILADIRGRDGYNWGYDPYHFFVPEGSYASDPDGPARVLETREMVAALNRMGLRVVLDVAFNHTFASGQEPFSVLDKIVPGYYYRRDGAGTIARSSCCPNTATEHKMMEKLMRDAVLYWAKAYKIDGFRFDLMGHHLLENMLAVRSDLDSLNLENDQVRGEEILLYGEGWDFGEVAGNARGLNASQTNIGGTGIGSFNDRIRDAGRGGGPFVGLETQGFLTGLAVDPNETDQGSLQHQRNHLLYLKDLIRLSLAGNLKDYEFTAASGERVSGADLEYRGTPAGYTEAPEENILYLAAHDNETLFDAIQYKVPRSTSMADRVRIQCLGLSLLALSQGVPFFHAGMEILRSKSLDRDSYRSGDWFNFLDFSYRTNNWGVGLPFADINQPNWATMRRLLADPSLKPSQEEILRTLRHFEEMLKIRMSSPLFRLSSAREIRHALHFHNTGPEQDLGLILMSILDFPEHPLDPHHEALFVLFNTAPQPSIYKMDLETQADIRLHSILAESRDPVVRTASFDPSDRQFFIPGRTAAVFVMK